ncbi:hemolysin family protein [Luteolibacter sp. LG18]|uniref:hemolysin family protein n=1 Tax=Luteolibacter sp. LG18 TaxID=2819286 RepID=UPI0030C75356
MSPWLPALAILFLIALNAFLSTVEIALVLCRESKLKAGDEGTEDALFLLRAPDNALSSSQAIVTLATVLTGAFASEGLAAPLAAAVSPLLHDAGWVAPLARVLVVPAVAGSVLLFGALVPKRIGLAHPEAVLRFTARTVRKWTAVFGPLARLFGQTADAITAVLRIKPAEVETVSEDDVKQIVREGGKSGALLPEESEMVEAVLGLDSLRVRELMTPRGDMVWLDAAAPVNHSFDLMLSSGHTRFPLHEGRRDNVLGVVFIQDVFIAQRTGGTVDLKALARPALLVPPTQPVIRLLETFRTSGSTFALVADEFGGISGIITMQDAVEAIIGDFQESPDAEPSVVERKDGSWLVDASLYFDEIVERFPDFPNEDEGARHYLTLNGFILQKLDHMPTTGETLEAGPYRIEVLDLDRNRVDKVLVTRMV